MSSPSPVMAGRLKTGSPTPMEKNMAAAGNGTLMRNSGQLSPLGWQQPRPASTSFSVPGVGRRETPSSSPTASWNMSPNAVHRQHALHTLDHGRVRSPTAIPGATAGVISGANSPAGEHAAIAATSLPPSNGMHLMPSAERVALLTGLSGFHDFAVRLPGFASPRASPQPTPKSTSDGVRSGDSATPPPPARLQQSQSSPRYSETPGAGHSRASGSFSARPFDVSLTHGTPNASRVSGSSETTRWRSNETGTPERDSEDAAEDSERPSTAPTARLQRPSVLMRGGQEGASLGSALASSNVSPSPPPSDVTATFHRYLEQTRHRILYADGSEVDRAVALDGLLTRSRELFDLLGEMYAAVQEQGTALDRRRLSMVKVLPYDEVSASSKTTSTSSSDTDSDSNSVSSSTADSSSSESSCSRQSIESSEPADDDEIPEVENIKKARTLSSTKRPRGSGQLPPLANSVVPSAAGTRALDVFERRRRTSASSGSSSVACIEVLNNYYVTRLIGVGATGRVYLAVDRHHCKTFAIKTVPRRVRKAIGRRFPLAAMSRSDSGALNHAGSLSEGAPLEAAVAPTLVTPGSMLRNHAQPWPLSVGGGANGSLHPSPSRRRGDLHESMDVSLHEAALESLLHVATLSHPSDAVIPFVESVTSSVSASVNEGGEAHMRGRTMSPPHTGGRINTMAPSPTRSAARAAGGSTQLNGESGEGSAAAAGTLGTAKPGDSAKDAVELSPVEREIRIMRRVRNHAHVVQLKEVIDDEEEDTVHLVMTYAEKGPLTAVQGFDPTFGCASCDALRPFSRCTRLLRQLAEALVYVHRQRIVHNDVKPDNILLTEADTVLLTDFGESILIPTVKKTLPPPHMSLSNAASEGLNTSVAVPHNRWKASRGVGDSWATLSMAERSSCSVGQGHYGNTSQVMGDTSFLPDSSMFLSDGVDVEGRLNGNRSAIGTPAFAAPELIMSSVCSYDSDTWSFGVVVYAVVFGRLPFAAATISDTFEEILNAPLSFPSLAEVPQRVGLSEDTYDQWVELCSRLLVREPQQRLPLEEVLLHPLFRSSTRSHSHSHVHSHSHTQARGGRPVQSPSESNRSRRPPSGRFAELLSSAGLRRSLRTGAASRPASGRELPPGLSPSLRSGLPVAGSRRTSAGPTVVLSTSTVATEASHDQLSPTSVTGSAVRDAVFDRPRLHAMAGGSQSSNTFTISGTSSASLGASGQGMLPLGRRAKAQQGGDAGARAAAELQPLSPVRLKHKSATQPTSPVTQEVPMNGNQTPSFVSPGSTSRVSDNGNAHHRAAAETPSSAVGSPVTSSLFTNQSRFPKPSHVEGGGSGTGGGSSVPVTARPSGNGMADPLPPGVTRPGIPAALDTADRAATGAAGGATAAAATAGASASGLAAVAAPAPPTSPSSASLSTRARGSAMGVPLRGPSHGGERRDTAPLQAQRRRSEEEPREGDGASVDETDYFPYWDSSMSDVTPGHESNDGVCIDSASVVETPLSEGESPRPKPPPRQSRRRSGGSSMSRSGGVTPLVSVQEVPAEHGNSKGRRKRVKFVPGGSATDAGVVRSATREHRNSRDSPDSGLVTNSPESQRHPTKPISPSPVDQRMSGGNNVISPRNKRLRQNGELQPPADDKQRLRRNN